MEQGFLWMLAGGIAAEGARIAAERSITEIWQPFFVANFAMASPEKMKRIFAKLAEILGIGDGFRSKQD